MFFFFFNDTATTEIYTLSLHDALPICCGAGYNGIRPAERVRDWRRTPAERCAESGRSEEHTSELQSRQYLVCRLLLEKKKKQQLSKTLKSRAIPPRIELSRTQLYYEQL